jgi:hypothetical protein
MEVHLHVFISDSRWKCVALYVQIYDLPVGDMVRPTAYSNVVILYRNLQENPSYLMYTDVSQ